ncbi:hypothetical protein LCGC14_2390070 [marine sediment metagenome]|uniref:Uncharacterized protein n=1 Tax=marine sediment metagenome TaxID=412755 RepID=A0A0F9BYE2_9ZZZZ
MIKDGMWFEDEADYQYYLHRMKKVGKAWEVLQEHLFLPICKHALELLRSNKTNHI